MLSLGISRPRWQEPDPPLLGVQLCGLPLSESLRSLHRLVERKRQARDSARASAPNSMKGRTNFAVIATICGSRHCEALCMPKQSVMTDCFVPTHA